MTRSVFEENDEEVNEKLIEGFNEEAAQWRQRRFFDNNGSGVNNISRGLSGNKSLITDLKSYKTLSQSLIISNKIL